MKMGDKVRANEMTEPEWLIGQIGKIVRAGKVTGFWVEFPDHRGFEAWPMFEHELDLIEEAQ